MMLDLMKVSHGHWLPASWRVWAFFGAIRQAMPEMEYSYATRELVDGHVFDLQRLQFFARYHF